jgi:hypothetical protein
VAGGRDWVAISAGFAAAIASGVVLLLEVISRSRIGKEKDATIDRMKQELKSLKSEHAEQIKTRDEKIADLSSHEIMAFYKEKIEQVKEQHAEVCEQLAHAENNHEKALEAGTSTAHDLEQVKKDLELQKKATNKAMKLILEAMESSAVKRADEAASAATHLSSLIGSYGEGYKAVVHPGDSHGPYVKAMPLDPPSPDPQDW